MNDRHLLSCHVLHILTICYYKHFSQSTDVRSACEALAMMYYINYISHYIILQ